MSQLKFFKFSNVKAMFVLLLACAMTATACSNQSSTSAPAPAQTGSNDNGGESSPEKHNDPGITDTTITIGTWGPQTGSAAAYGLTGKGMDAYVQYINEQGGINGRKIEFKFYDDAYQPAKAVAAAKKLVEEDNVFAIVGTIGTASNLAPRDYLIEKGVPVLSLGTGSSVFTDPVVKTYFAIQPNYRAEGRLLTKYTVEELGKEKIGVLYQNDDFGKDNLAGVEDYLKGAGLEIAVSVPYAPQDVDFSTAAIKFKEAGVDAVILCTFPKAAASLANELKKLDVGAQLVANSSSGSDANVMFELAGDAWEGAITINYGPNPNDDTPAMKTFREAMKKAYPAESENSTFAMRGFAAMDVLLEALRRTGDDLTRENLIKELESFDDWSGDYAEHITYTPEDHRGTSMMYIMQAKDGANVKITDYLSMYE